MRLTAVTTYTALGILIDEILAHSLSSETTTVKMTC
jgi:hypothetical protein